MTERANPAPQAASIQGYRRKPTWIPIVAIFFILTPFGNFLMTLYSLNIPRWYAWDVWAYWVRYVPTLTWVLMSCIFVSGISLLFFVRKWALVWTMATLALVLIYNMAMIRAFSLMGTVAVSGMMLTTVAATYFLYFSRFRRPYMNPKMRWWETSPRFKTEIPVKIPKSTHNGVLVDVSLTGALIEWSTIGDIPVPQKVTQLELPPGLTLACEVARSTEKGYGIKFNLDRTSSKKFKLWLKQLETDPSQLTW